jgi:hypothetical protein
LDEIGLVVYEEMSFKAKVYGRTDGQRTDGRRTKRDHKSSPCHFVTGELKRGSISGDNCMISRNFPEGKSALAMKLYLSQLRKDTMVKRQDSATIKHTCFCL